MAFNSLEAIERLAAIGNDEVPPEIGQLLSDIGSKMRDNGAAKKAEAIHILGPEESWRITPAKDAEAHIRNQHLQRMLDLEYRKELALVEREEAVTATMQSQVPQQP